MNTAALTIGAGLIGWLVPEFVLMLSPCAANFKRVPLFINLVSVAGFVLIAFGVSR